MSISIIVAYDQTHAIGARGDLPWGRSLPGDLANFKRLTYGGSVIMGRKTFDSIGRKPLPGRENIVISRKPTGVSSVMTAINISSALALARYEVFIIGGGQVYADTLDLADTIYATEVLAEFPNADTFFPELSPEWQETSRVHHPQDVTNRYAFDFVQYSRLR